MNTLLLFSDGSVSTQSKIGIGAYLIAPKGAVPTDFPHVNLKRFDHTSSTKLELQTLLWALSDSQLINHKIEVYTDSQNIIGLQGRRQRLERQNYKSGNGTSLTNCELYKEFFAMTDRLDCSFFKVKGHMVANQKDEIAKLFTLVDRASRKALRMNQLRS